MIIKRKNGGNTRQVFIRGGYQAQINGVSIGTSIGTGFTLGANGVETLVFERNASDVTNRNWRVYSI